MKTVLITGANRGIGLEFSNQYAADGWRVLSCARSPEKSDALHRLATRHPDQVSVHALDVTDHVQIDQLAGKLADQTIDVLINNAGIYAGSHANAFNNTDYEAWRYSFLVNAMASLKMAQAFRSHIARSSQKTIVTISSKMGSLANNTSGGSYIYRSSKAAVNMVIKSLAIDLNAAGVIAVVLHPGWVKTDMGGPHALISTTQSVCGMRQVISQLALEDSGSFISYDGQTVAW